MSFSEQEANSIMAINKRTGKKNSNHAYRRTDGGKGDQSRIKNQTRYAENYDRIFGKKKEEQKTSGASLSQFNWTQECRDKGYQHMLDTYPDTGTTIRIIQELKLAKDFHFAGKPIPQHVVEAINNTETNDPAIDVWVESVRELI